MGSPTDRGTLHYLGARGTARPATDEQMVLNAQGHAPPAFGRGAPMPVVARAQAGGTPGRRLGVGVPPARRVGESRKSAEPRAPEVLQLAVNVRQERPQRELE